MPFQVPGTPGVELTGCWAIDRPPGATRSGQNVAGASAADGALSGSMQESPCLLHEVTASSDAEPAVVRKCRALFRRFVEGDDKFRNERFKLIPRVVEGPWIVQRAVGAQPALLGQKLTQRYFRGPDYFEVDVHVDSSVIASQITRMCRNKAKNIVVDIAVLNQGETPAELPEMLMGAFQMRYPDCDWARAPIELTANDCKETAASKRGVLEESDGAKARSKWEAAVGKFVIHQ